MCLISGLITCGPAGVLYNAKEYPSIPQKRDFGIVYLNKKKSKSIFNNFMKISH